MRYLQYIAEKMKGKKISLEHWFGGANVPLRSLVKYLLILLTTAGTLLSLGFLGERCDVSTYRGDGTLAYKPKVGLLGSDGYTLTFESFPLSGGLAKTLSLSKLPVPSKGNSFFLVFKPETEIPTNLLDTIHINTTLKDNEGTTLWNIRSTMKQWVKTSTRGLDYHDCHYSFVSWTSEPSFCRFIPDPAKSYCLEINFAVSPMSNRIPKTGYFYLDAGGFK